MWDWEKAQERVNRYADANAAPFDRGRMERMDKLFRSIGVVVCSRFTAGEGISVLRCDGTWSFLHALTE